MTFLSDVSVLFSLISKLDEGAFSSIIQIIYGDVKQLTSLEVPYFSRNVLLHYSHVLLDTKLESLNLVK